MVPQRSGAVNAGWNLLQTPRAAAGFLVSAEGALAQSDEAAPATTVVAHGEYRSPGLAAALSLTPMPVDFGNFYAENPEMGVVWTAAETGLMAAMMWSSWDGGMMGHGYDRDGDGSRDRWTAADRDRTAALAVAYVGVKLVSALQASQSARLHNDRLARVQVALIPTDGGAFAAGRFP